jgi:hypothetical protein
MAIIRHRKVMSATVSCTSAAVTGLTQLRFNELLVSLSGARTSNEIGKSSEQMTHKSSPPRFIACETQMKTEAAL